MQTMHQRHNAYAKKLNEFLKNKSPEELLHLEGSGTNSLAAWFLGPKAENGDFFIGLISEGIRANCVDRQNYFPKDPIYVTDKKKDESYWKSQDKIQYEYIKLLNSLQGSVPFFSYRYQAHMNWDLTIPGMIGYFSAMLYNQNNVAAEASPVTSHLEALVGDDLCQMLGFTIPDKSDENAIRPWGHITCDGTVANLEAMWAARNLKYYAISVAEALKREDALGPAKWMTVPLRDGGRRQLIDLDTWALLNLRIDDVLDLTQRMERIYGISPEIISKALDQYTIQSLGFNEFNSRYLKDVRQPVIMGPATKHYSWPKNAAVLGIGKNNYKDIKVDLDARMDIKDLRSKLDKCLENNQPILMVVVVLGSTEESAVDPLADVIALREEYRKKGLEFAIHIDAAWGGYFASLLWEVDAVETVQAEVDSTPVLNLSEYVRKQYEAIPGADSVSIDPHKAGYIPYPAGGLCYRNKSMRNLVAFLAPEVYHGEQVDAAMGVFGIEGSKPGAAAAGVYLSHRIIRPDRSGYGKILGKALFNSKRFYSGIITLAELDDPKAKADCPFIVVPVQQIPAERKGGSKEEIDKQLQDIKNNIVCKENWEIKENKKATDLLNQLGSDQIIITYAFNFKETDGTLNKDPVRANEFNHKIFERLSLSPDPEHNRKVPLIITTSQFEPEVYGEEFVRTFMKRLGVDDSKLITMNFLSSTTMCPWLTDTEGFNNKRNFIPVLTDALRDTVIDVAREFRGEKNL